MHSGGTLVHGQTTGKHRFTRLTIACTWGKPPPSPLYYTLCLATGPTPKCHFVLELPNGSPKIPTRTPATLGAHNFACKPPIDVRSKAKLYFLLRALQRCVACHLHTRKSGRFLTFSGQKSNWQFDSWPFFWP
jgi:hypothetical protein